MSFDRPTFSELWHRVANLKPRLRIVVQIHRQFFRGELWYVAQDSANNQFFRIHPSAYNFLARLDGERTVAEAWNILMEQMGDDALTQGEVIQFLGKLYTSNLLQSDVPPDVTTLFKRYETRTKKEMRNALTSILFMRIPLLDPDRFLDRWTALLGLAFTRVGFALWVVMLFIGGFHVVGNISNLGNRASAVLDPSNLPLLYFSFMLVKVFHEFGHAVACKKFGRDEGGGGEVHVMGIILLVLMPFPYVDASSSWALRERKHRIIIGAGGIFVELFLASLAAVIWANTGQGTTLHAIAYNVMFVASVSTVLFNGNPLLRYDAYYILSDLLEIPNLRQRSADYFYYLVKRWLWSIKEIKTPEGSAGEKRWLLLYFVSSTIWRFFVYSAIILFIAGKFFFIGIVMAGVGMIGWVGRPVWKFADYLFSSRELSRVRFRAFMISLGIVFFLVSGLGLVPFPDRFRVEGVVEPRELATVYAGASGFLKESLGTETVVDSTGPSLFLGESMDLRTKKEELLAEMKALETEKNMALKNGETARGQIIFDRMEALKLKMEHVKKEEERLSPVSSIKGTWVSPDLEKRIGSFFSRGEKLGMVASLDNLIIRATAGQETAANIISQGSKKVEMRVKGRPEMKMAGAMEKILPSGRKHLPSKALGYGSGGAIETSPEDETGTETTERFFEIIVTPDKNHGLRLLSGQRVVVRFNMKPKPLLIQFSQSVRRLLQKRFHI